MARADFSFGPSYSRRLPIFLLLDTSESMIGEPLDAVNAGLQQLCTDLKNDVMAIETAWVSVITFDSRARQPVPLTEILNFNAPTLSVGPGTSMGAAFDLLAQSIKKDVRKNTATQKGDWKPIVFLLTDGQPTDDWQAALQRLKKETTSTTVNIIAVGCGDDVDLDMLKAVTPSVLVMKSASPGAFKAFFRWVSASVSSVSVSAAREGHGVKLPDLPAKELEPAGREVPRKPGTKAATQIILAARCRDSKKGYLMRYRSASPSGDAYQAEKAYQVSNDYFIEASAAPTGQAIDSSKLHGAPPCPYCGRPAWTMSPDKSGLICADRLELGRKRTQVMFVLDCTGSMAGEIDGVKENIKDFIDYIQSKELSVEVGLIAFRDLEMHEPPELLNFAGRIFTNDVGRFKGEVSRLTAHGGGANPGESSFDALALACEQPFQKEVVRILVLIADEPPLCPDGRVRTVEDLFAAMRRAPIDQLHIVIPDHLRSYYATLHSQAKGQIFSLGAGGRGGTAFRDILMDIGESITVMTRLG